METEIEAKWLNINVDEFRVKLKNLGAVLIDAERSMTRQNFDFSDERLGKNHGWVRIRDENGRVTMSYKQLNDRTLHGTKEATVMVDSFEDACKFVESIGLISNSIQETKRESWKLGDVEIEIDTWPWIPSFVEIEAKTEQLVREAAEKLGLNFADALHGSVEVAYQAYYNVTEQEVDSWPEIRFGEVPDWLVAKRIKS